MTRILVALVALVALGCGGPKYVELPTAGTDLTAFIASAGPFQQRGEDCVIGVTFRDGVKTEVTLRGERCAAGVTWLRLDALIRQQQQAARSPAPPPPARDE